MHSLHLAYAAADLVVSRARAMTCSEILATGKPSILVKITTPPNKAFLNVLNSLKEPYKF